MGSMVDRLEAPLGFKKGVLGFRAFRAFGASRAFRVLGFRV